MCWPVNAVVPMGMPCHAGVCPCLPCAGCMILILMQASAPDPTTGTLLFNWSNICMHFFAVDWLNQVRHACNGCHVKPCHLRMLACIRVQVDAYPPLPSIVPQGACRSGDCLRPLKCMVASTVARSSSCRGLRLTWHA